MLGPRLARFNAWLRERARRRLPHGRRHQQRAGDVGQRGLERRLEYSGVGDTTNTAARLESATKELGVPCCSRTPRAHHLTRADGLAEVATIAVKGREQQVRVWTLPETAEAARPAATVQRAGN